MEHAERHDVTEGSGLENGEWAPEEVSDWSCVRSDVMRKESCLGNGDWHQEDVVETVQQ